MKFPKEVLDKFAQSLSERSYSKGSFLLRPGTICQEIFFINQGLVRQYYVKNDNEFIRQFFFENGLATDLASIESGKPSRMYIQAIEQTEVLVIPAKALTFIPAVHQFTLSGNLVKVAERMASIFLDSPEEQYLDILANRPKVLARVPQFMIAAYLGITPEGLSRIKKRIADRERS